MFKLFNDHNNHLIIVNLNQIVKIEPYGDNSCMITTTESVTHNKIFINESFNAVINKLSIK